ncbi:hypothetical protein C0J52_26583 [Blattella germanica]|nr:hypothetical protein C0J52_26583 [Blattella germanica]
MPPNNATEDLTDEDSGEENDVHLVNSNNFAKELHAATFTAFLRRCLLAPSWATFRYSSVLAPFRYTICMVEFRKNLHYQTHYVRKLL